MIAPPPGVGRHFAGEAIDLAQPRGRARVIERLLEDGDRRDLAWMRREIPRHEIAAWLARHAARRLSRRSRALWTAAFALPCPATPPAAAALWPLA